MGFLHARAGRGFPTTWLLFSFPEGNGGKAGGKEKSVVAGQVASRSGQEAGGVSSLCPQGPMGGPATEVAGAGGWRGLTRVPGTGARGGAGWCPERRPVVGALSPTLSHPWRSHCRRCGGGRRFPPTRNPLQRTDSSGPSGRRPLASPVQGNSAGVHVHLASSHLDLAQQDRAAPHSHPQHLRCSSICLSRALRSAA